jgi:hypothetical protein
MEVDAIRHGPLSAEEKAWRRNLGLCSYCGGAGHFQHDCPNKSAKAKANDLKRAQASSSSGKA